jgi:hypothetical protein
MGAHGPIHPNVVVIRKI